MKKMFQVAAILALGIHVNAQGTFQNLDFEAGTFWVNSGFVGYPYFRGVTVLDGYDKRERTDFSKIQRN